MPPHPPSNRLSALSHPGLMVPDVVGPPEAKVSHPVHADDRIPQPGGGGQPQGHRRQPRHVHHRAGRLHWGTAGM